MRIFGRWRSKRNWFVTFGLFVAGFVVVRFLGQSVLPSLMYARDTQPVDFSHAVHGEDMGISCETCHFFYEDGNWSGTPSTEVCAECHIEAMGESAAEATLVNDYVSKNKEMQWALYFRQPQCVSFSHSSHVRRAKLGCETCHGPQGLSKHPTEYLVNRITKYSYVVYDSDLSVADIIGKKEKNVWGTMGMQECANCHRARGTSTACFICHK